MPYFLYEGRLECGQEAELIGTEAAHASKSRRLREGEIFEVQDEQPQRFEAKVLENARNRLSFIVETRLEPPPESSFKLERRFRRRFQSIFNNETQSVACIIQDFCFKPLRLLILDFENLTFSKPSGFGGMSCLCTNKFRFLTTLQSTFIEKIRHVPLR